MVRASEHLLSTCVAHNCCWVLGGEEGNVLYVIIQDVLSYTTNQPNKIHIYTPCGVMWVVSTWEDILRTC